MIRDDDGTRPVPSQWHHTAPSMNDSVLVWCAACAKNVLTFSLRSPANWQPSMPSRHSAQHPACSDSKSTKPAAIHADDTHTNTSSCCIKDTCQYDGVMPLAPDLRLDTSPVEQGYADASVQGVTKSEETASTAVPDLDLDLDDALHDAQQLVQAAERIVMESCGEAWLLQPFIPDMERNEYRWAHASPVSVGHMLHIPRTQATLKVSHL